MGKKLILDSIAIRDRENARKVEAKLKELGDGDAKLVAPENVAAAASVAPLNLTAVAAAGGMTAAQAQASPLTIDVRNMSLSRLVISWVS